MRGPKPVYVVEDAYTERSLRLSSAIFMTPEDISAFLYHLDPMGTCCNVNEGMENEYASIARGVFDSYYNGVPIFQSIVQELNWWFGEDLVTEKKKELILHALMERVSCT